MTDVPQATASAPKNVQPPPRPVGTVAAPPAEPKPKPFPFTALLSSQFSAGVVGERFGGHEARLPAGTPPEYLGRREFWANVAQLMHPNDTIEVRVADHTWRARVVVWEAGMNWAHVSVVEVLQKPHFDMPAGQDEYGVRWNMDASGHEIYRLSDGVRAEGPFANVGDAMQAIARRRRR